MTESTIFTARRIATLEGARPTATAVAIRDGQILAVGDESELRAHGPARLDARFADRFILPGFVEAHAHVTAGANWKHCYVGYYDRVAPDGKIRPGARSLDEVIDRLARAERVLPDPDQPLLGWAFDPIFFGGRRMTAAQLDRISTTRPIAIYHQSAHAINVNSLVMDMTGLGPSTEVDGILLDPSGKPTGELREVIVMHIVFHTLGVDFQKDAASETGIRILAGLPN